MQKHRQRACGVLSDVHGNSYGPKPAVHAEELVLMAVMLEQPNEYDSQQDEYAGSRLQSDMEVLVGTAWGHKVSSTIALLQTEVLRA